MEKVKPGLIEAKLVEKKQLTQDVIELHFESNPPFNFESGQFVSIIVAGKGPGGRDLRRAYSIASNPEKPRFELCVKVIENGPGTQYLDKLQLGETMKGMAPYGDFIYKTTQTAKHVIMIATGTGIAPFRAMLFSKHYEAHRPASCTLLFGARDTHDLIYTDELTNLSGLHFVQALSRPGAHWGGFKGRVTDWLREHQHTIHWKNTEFYLCGNGAMIDEAKQILHGHGVEKAHIHQEIYYKPKPGEAHAN